MLMWEDCALQLMGCIFTPEELVTRIISSHQHSTDISGGGGGRGRGNGSCCNAVHSNIHVLPEQRYKNYCAHG